LNYIVTVTPLIPRYTQTVRIWHSRCKRCERINRHRGKESTI